MTTTPAPSISTHDLLASAVGPFATSWVYADASDVTALIKVAGDVTPLTQGTDYTLSATAPLTSGGSVTLAAGIVPVGGWPAGARLVLRRRTARRQATALPDTEGHKPRVTERALDRQMRIAQEDADELARAVLAPIGEVPMTQGELIAMTGDNVVLAEAAREVAVQAGATAAVQATLAEGAKNITVAALAAFEASQNIVYLADFFGSPAGSAPVPYFDPAQTISYAARSAAPDVTQAFQRALQYIEYAFPGQRDRVIKCPSGILNLSGTIALPTGVAVMGQGKGIDHGATHFRRTGNYGDTFRSAVIGPDTFCSNIFVTDCVIYQDHGGNNQYGTDWTPAANFINKATTGAHLRLTGAVFSGVARVETYGMPEGMVFKGGRAVVASSTEVYGIWDTANPSRQEGINGVVVEANANSNGINIPTYFHLDLTVGGYVTPGVAVTYPGGFSKTTVRNDAWQNGLVLRCYEELRVYLNVSACQKKGALIQTSSGAICQGLDFTGVLSPCGTDNGDAAFKVENLDPGGQARFGRVRALCLGQSNAYRFVSDLGSDADHGSMLGFEFDLTGGNCVGAPVWLEKARATTIRATLLDYNTDDFYRSGAASAVFIAAGCRNIRVQGILGGSATGERTGHHCRFGVYAQDYLTTGVDIDVLDGGCVEALYVGPPVPVGISIGATKTLVWGVDSPTQFLLSSIATDQTLTFSTANMTPDAAFEISRLGGGAGNWIVNDGGSTRTLAVNQACRVRAIPGVGFRFV